MFIISLILITLGILTIILNYNNYIILLIALELLLIGISFYFINYSINFDDFYGIISSFFLLTIGAVESAIGLTILITYYQSLQIEKK